MMSLRSLGLISDQTMREHRARWFVYAGPAGGPFEKIPHDSRMRGSWWGYDVTCSCGWESHTGGAVRSYVADKLDEHRFDAQGVAERVAAGRPVTAIRGLRAGQHGVETMGPDGVCSVVLVLWDGAGDEEGYSTSDLRYEEGRRS